MKDKLMDAIPIIFFILLAISISAKDHERKTLKKRVEFLEEKIKILETKKNG